MIVELPTFSWMYRLNNQKPKFEIRTPAGTLVEDVTGRMDPARIEWLSTENGIGAWNAEISSPAASKGSAFSEGMELWFYGDLGDDADLQYKGRIDSIQETYSRSGRTLRMKGRHKYAVVLQETPVTLRISDARPAEVYTAIIGQLPTGHGITTADVEDIDGSVSVTYQNMPASEALRDLHLKADASGYIDADGGAHFFKSDSRTNLSDAAVLGNTIVGIAEFGKDTFQNRNKVIVQGKSDEGSTIVAQAGTGSRVVTVFSGNVKTYGEAVKLAEALLTELKDEVPQGKVTCTGLPYVRPGENIWVVDRNIYGMFRVIKLAHLRRKPRKWLTEVTFEKAGITVGGLIRKLQEEDRSIVELENEHNMVKTVHLPFDDYSGLSSHSSVDISGGEAGISSGSSNGSMTTETRNETENVTAVYLQVVGDNLEKCIYEVSTDDGVNWKTVSPFELALVAGGKKLKVRIGLNKDNGVSPILKDLALGYRF